MDSKSAPGAADLSFDRRAVTLDRPFLSGPFHWAPGRDAAGGSGPLTRAAIIGLIPVTMLYLISIVVAIILLLPLTRPGTVARRGMGILPAIVHFPALALSFLFISAVLEEKVGLWLTDRTASAALTPATMMICAGLSSMWAIRFGVGTPVVSGTAMAVILIWLAAALLGLDGLILGTLYWAGPMRAMLNVVVLIPVSIAFGVLFALRLARVPAGSFLLWVWSLTAACAALAFPLARLLSWENGLSGVFLAAGVLIGVAILTFPPVYRPKEGEKAVARGVPNEGLGSEAPGSVSST